MMAVLFVLRSLTGNVPPTIVHQADSVAVCVRDAANGTPLTGATVRDARGTSRVMRTDCEYVARRDGPLQLARIGYRPQTVAINGDPRDATPAVPLVVALVPRIGAATGTGVTMLETRRVRANAEEAAPAGGIQATLTGQAARERGMTTMNGLLALLPYTSLRSSRGESALSLRGARREQVVVTLDGLPLNDPATGVADVSDLPLVAVQSASVRPGADPLGTGSGATGGVLALSSASQRFASVRGGSFGQRAVEAAWAATTATARWNASVSYRRAANDFAFVNDAGAVAVRETRVNNDESRAVLTAGVVTGRTQWSALVSTGERGMVGPANVRAYDEDRSRTTRALVRGQTAIGASMLTTGLRSFSLAYRDPQSPALDARAQVWAGDVEWRGPVAIGAVVGTWRVGTGADVLRGTGNLRQQRTRGFVAWGWQRPRGATARVDADVGLRADVVEGNGAQPSASAGVSWRLHGTRSGSSVSWLARASQAMRVPTLYDLYFSSPQRLSVKALAPERVPVDVGSGVQGAWQRGDLRISGEALAVARDTREAIIWFPGNFGWSPANVGRERLRGTEARGEFASPTLVLSVWHTWYRSLLRTGPLEIPTPYVAPHSAGAHAMWRRGAHTLSSTVRYQGRRPFTAGPRNPLFELSAVTLADVAWAHQQDVAHVRTLWSFTLENVTDTRWQSVRGFPMPGRGWSVALTLAPRP